MSDTNDNTPAAGNPPATPATPAAEPKRKNVTEIVDDIGAKKIRRLEEQVSTLQDNLDTERENNKTLKSQLESLTKPAAKKPLSEVDEFIWGRDTK